MTKDGFTNEYSLTTKHQTVYMFNAAGELISIKDRNDNTMTFAYQNVLATVPDYEEPTQKLILDDFQDGNLNFNVLGKWTSDDGTLSSFILENKAVKFSWTTGDYWYSLFGTGVEKIDLSNRTHFYFRVKGISGGGNFNIELQNDGFGVKLPLSSYVTATTDWQMVSIPLVDFSNLG